MSEEKKQKSDEIKEFGALMLNENKKNYKICLLTIAASSTRQSVSHSLKFLASIAKNLSDQFVGSFLQSQQSIVVHDHRLWDNQILTNPTVLDRPPYPNKPLCPYRLLKKSLISSILSFKCHIRHRQGWLPVPIYSILSVIFVLRLRIESRKKGEVVF